MQNVLSAVYTCTISTHTSWRVETAQKKPFTYHFQALENEMATHSSIHAWRIPGTEEPSGLLSMGSHKVGHDWSDLAAADSILKSRDTTLPTKVHLVKAMVFPVVMYGCESWTIKKAERRRIYAFELWYWSRLLRVPWTARRLTSPFWRGSALGFLWKKLC